jgi:hypothetical protein
MGVFSSHTPIFLICWNVFLVKSSTTLNLPKNIE